MTGTTLEKLMKDKCYCIKKKEDIKLDDCVSFDCNRWKKCKNKTNADINKDLEKQNKRDKNGKKV